MISIHPLMSSALQNRIVSYNILGDGNEDEIMTQWYDEVHDAIMTMCEHYGINFQHVNEEFCIDDSGFPTDPHQPIGYNKGTINGESK